MAACMAPSRGPRVGSRTGWTRSLWVAGDLVVSYEGLFELAAYEPGQSGPFPR